MCVSLTWCLCPQCSHSRPTGGPVAAEYFILKSQTPRSTVAPSSQVSTWSTYICILCQKKLKQNTVCQQNLFVFLRFCSNNITSLSFFILVVWPDTFILLFENLVSENSVQVSLYLHCPSFLNGCRTYFFPLSILLPMLCKWKEPQPTQL